MVGSLQVASLMLRSTAGVSLGGLPTGFSVKFLLLVKVAVIQWDTIVELRA